ncbi:protein of unknown function [Candidatus Filomicrobium marinum]|uniref:Uncharacterized protein n=1 Tax=Candidatus Filomicrobium marinum TaxID=1608628 RepID=A0A0D6JCH1_9HYPH|nr:protein of unknown function [Candidatus Filomicrobium marinum]CPR16467.1 protein of unknown function [Candidatus Filomicrobium marinum]
MSLYLVQGTRLVAHHGAGRSIGIHDLSVFICEYYSEFESVERSMEVCFADCLRVEYVADCHGATDMRNENAN